MGQMVLGVMLGCKLPKKLPKAYYDQDGESVIEEWNAEFKFGDRRRVEQVDIVLGLWVVCQHGEEKGVPDIDRPVDLGLIETSQSYRVSLVAWHKFDQWMIKKGVMLPAAQLWLAPTEVA